MVLVRTQVVDGGPTAPWSTKHFLWGPASQWQTLGTPAVNSHTLDDAAKMIAAVFMVPQDGTLDRIAIPVTTKTGASATIKYVVGFYTVDTATGFPTTTAYGGMSPAIPTLTSFTNGAVNWISLVTGATAVAGDVVAAVIKAEGVDPPTAAAKLLIRRSIRTGGGAAISLPYELSWTTAWTKQGDFPLLVPRYSTGDVAEPFFAMNAITAFATAFGSASTPDEQGAKFSVPWSVPCRGARISLDPLTAAFTAIVKLYDSADTLLASATLPTNTLGQLNTGLIDVFWDAVTLTADTDYRLTVLPTTTDTATLLQIVTADTDSKNSIACGDRFQLTTRTDAGAWTDTANTVPMHGLWLAGAA